MRRFLILAALLLFAGCVSVPRSRTLPAVDLLEYSELADALQQEVHARRILLEQYPVWTFQGRAALRYGKEGGNVRIDWQQIDRRIYQVELSVPVTRQSWRLTGNSHHEGGRLEGLDGGTLESENLEELLYEATGWHIPVNLMSDWVRGLPAIDTARAVRALYDPSGTLRRIEQRDWVVEYQDWYPVQEGHPALPRRIEVTSAGTIADGQAHVRLIVDSWQWPSLETPHDVP